MGNFNPKNPTKFRGTDKYIAFFVSRNRQPTSADYRQPETGNLYSVGTIWQVGKDPTTGTEGDLWMLSKIVANQGYWIQITGNDIPSDSFIMQTGTSPVVPNASGEITFNGAVVAAGTNPVRTDGTGANTMALEVQISQAIAATDATKIGLSNFNSSHFDVDANGFVSIPGVSGSFTPTVTFGGASTGITYDVNEGRYSQIGDMIFFSLYIDMSNKGSATGNAAIAGFPQDVGGISSQIALVQTDDVTFTAGFNAPFLRPLTGATKTAELWQTGDGVIGDHLTDTNFANTTTIRCQGYYFL